MYKFPLNLMCCFKPTDIEKSDKDINENDCIDSNVYPIKNTQSDTTTNQPHNLKKVEYLVDSSNYKKFNLENLKGHYYVKSVYDGDTITLIIPMNINNYSFDNNIKEQISIEKLSIDYQSNSNPSFTINYYEVRIRILGIDTPEMKPSKNLPNREEHIKKAKDAQKFLSDMILNKIIYCEFIQNDKYGRPLANIYYENQSISEIMINKGHAKPYSGGTKDTDF
jgi:endonuclease YncB( thermonuclease family)